MEKQSTSFPGARSNRSILVSFIALCVGLIGCVLVIPNENTAVPELQPTIVASVVPTDTATAIADIVPTLDDKAEPLFGSTNLQRGMFPDPHSVEVTAGGNVDTSVLDRYCGYVTSAPSFSFSLSGGASETFLRIYFANSDGTDTTLLVYTPKQEWLCEDNSADGKDPVIDIEFGPSGTYAIWVGTHENGTYGKGSLFITQSADNHP